MGSGNINGIPARMLVAGIDREATMQVGNGVPTQLTGRVALPVTVNGCLLGG